MHLVRLKLFIIFISGTLTGAAQNIPKMFESAEKLFYKEDFRQAQLAFQEVVDLNPKYKDADYKLEISTLLLKENREKALDRLLSYKATKGKSDKFYYYWLGRVYANRDLYTESIKAWESFLKSKSPKSPEIVKETKGFIEESNRLNTFFNDPCDYEVKRLDAPINSIKAEMTPVYSEISNELIFASSVASDEDEFKIYRSKRTNMEWSTPSIIANLGSFDRFSAKVEVADDGQKLFIYKDDRKGNLHFSERTNDNWTIPVEFDSKITRTHLNSQFFINKHEDRIIFTSYSDFKLGLGLYESYRDVASGNWSTPLRFAVEIDSEWNEDSPYLSFDESKLYFSSDREGGMGGFDIYVTALDPETLKWGEPKNLGWPINSPDDEFHFKLNDDEQSGFFISNRIHTLGDYDIFAFWNANKTIVKGEIINKLTGFPVNSGELRFYPKLYNDEYFTSTLNEHGEYEIRVFANQEFNIEYISETDTLFIESFEVLEDEKVTHIKDFFISTQDFVTNDTFPVTTNKGIAMTEAKKTIQFTNENQEVSTSVKEEMFVSQDYFDFNDTFIDDIEELSSKFRLGNKVIAGNIYFDFGTIQLNVESLPTLERILSLLNQNTSIIIEIAGHSDNIGNENINLKISTSRAETVRKWLINKGISKSRLIAKGYGSSQPIATNDDEKEGRELNRRIEIRRLNN
ncbi:MAG: OmpA family protein [Cyclobacteriaceae bacterium]